MDSGHTQQQIYLLSVLKEEIDCIKSLDKININDSEIVFVIMVTEVENIWFFHKNQGAEESCQLLFFKRRHSFKEAI